MSEAALRLWFASRGWTPAAFQREVWLRYLKGESGLLHTPTGSGKTLAAFGGPLLEALQPPGPDAPASRSGLRVLWVTPLRALATDTARALREPITGLGLPWQVTLRTGDASARDKQRAREGRTDVLVTTPESLALLLSYPDGNVRWQGLRAIVVDEWHELLGSKRGVLLQLGLAHLRGLAPGVRIWGLSATLGNLDDARQVLLPHVPRSALVSGARPRAVRIRTLLPQQGPQTCRDAAGPRGGSRKLGSGPAFPREDTRLPWAGHLGLARLGEVRAQVLKVRSSLVFTNTRAQAELWFRALASVWPESADTLALHHGSLDPALRNAAEQGLREGTVRCVVCTSSLDLGVDFPAVDQVLQIGSPKGVARLLQRAGRARHRPGAGSTIYCVPAQALELAEYAAAREALAAGVIEPRIPPRLCLDVLAQHCVTLALGGGFEPAALLAQVRGTHAYAGLDDATWQAVLDFIVQGGAALAQYPDYHRVVRDADGHYRVHDRRIALRHRLSIGTIAADGSVTVRLMTGGTLGSVEESFVGRLKRGERFQFAGRLLELLRLEGMTAWVRKATPSATPGSVAVWQGGRMPLSTELGRAVEQLFAQPGPHAELRALQPLLALQRESSALPAPGTLLVEHLGTARGHHLFLHPFAGRTVHEGLAQLLALRLGRRRPQTFTYTALDHGLMLSSPDPIALDAADLVRLLHPGPLIDDLQDSLNVGELARRQFREIAHIAGLLPPSMPGRGAPSLRQLQVSSGLLFDVFTRHDPQHLLLGQARREVLTQQMDIERLRAVLDDCAGRRIVWRTPRWLTPLSFPLWAEGLRGQLSTEDWQTRVRRAAEQLQARYERQARRPARSRDRAAP